MLWRARRGLITPVAAFAGGTPASSETNVTWTGLANAADDGGGVIRSSASPPGGGRGTVALDATQAFDVLAYMTADAANQSALVYVDDDNTNNYAYDASNDWLCGWYEFGNQVFSTEIGGTSTSRGAVTFPCIIRMRKSSDDVVLAFSTDGGSNYTTLTTFSGVLSGQSTIYIKCLFGLDLGQSIRVTYVQ